MYFLFQFLFSQVLLSLASFTVMGSIQRMKKKMEKRKTNGEERLHFCLRSEEEIKKDLNTKMLKYSLLKEEYFHF